VVPPGEIGVKFQDIGALEDVKKALNELVILPMRRPELFSHGNLLRVLIFCLICILIRAGGMHFQCDFANAFLSLAKEYYFLGLLELGKPSLPRLLQQKLGQTLSA
jgi:hypothetical protein